MTTTQTRETEAVQRYRRACDYAAAAMIYLKDNVLLREPLRREHLKPRLLGHWGTCPGITFLYGGLNGLVRRTGQRTLLVTGPGHGAPAVHANLWLEGTHARLDPALSRDGAGLAELVRRFSWPGGFPSHLSPEVPGVLHEGGELGYALATAFGAALDKPDLLVACLVGDGEAETGPTAGSWHANKYLSPRTDGAVLPVLHVNGYKISSPTVYGCMSDEELVAYFRGAGWSPHVVDVTATDDPDGLLAEALDLAHGGIAAVRERWRPGERAVWPMLVLRSPKGWGVPARDAGGKPLEGTFRAHQVPLGGVHEDDAEFALLERWLRSYRPEELFDADGRPHEDLLAALPPEELRLGRAPEANGGRLRRDLPLPDLAPFAVEVAEPGGGTASPTGVAGRWLAELVRATEDRRDFRVVCPDELESNRLGALLEATDRGFTWPLPGTAEHVAPGGRVLEVLSEHLCQGWLQGYLLTGRHGLFPCYEAFAPIVDSMVNQYAKFLKVSGEVAWREPVASMNHLLTSEGWRQEHNGYSHQGPGFLNNLLTRKASTARVYLPPDANTLLVTLRDCLASTDRINLVVAGKNAGAQWLDLAAAERHCAAGAGTWEWAGHGDGDPDVVLACAGGIPTVEVLAAASILRERAPDLTVRVVNVVDLLSLAPADRRPHGLADEDFAACFPEGVPVVFGFHGYPSAVHETLHGRPDTERFHVHGYLEEGTTTTPFDLLVGNGMSRHDLAADALRRTGRDDTAVLAERDELREAAHRDGVDSREITEWRWGA
ncbi:phosphoketolase family protein [Saccharothrix algeriensis]|uniref:Xylulose-5-phosphate/fructose-6-phosphate phosphoketolase n=1 Tax=Saccharothrix algeriensis TaxID=173560 RepID=A0ABS2SEE4_9PSEU|nr:phosphoketolase family protein [Saccharothrix algeriensis]MBM7814603.1 xylulose-5-phosphate/fructose-6-phosphate phosphoketolase [Saccharothrix algeriensis]